MEEIGIDKQTISVSFSRRVEFVDSERKEPIELQTDLYLSNVYQLTAYLVLDFQFHLSTFRFHGKVCHIVLSAFDNSCSPLRLVLNKLLIKYKIDRSVNIPD
jgi:hypothetical protein